MIEEPITRNEPDPSAGVESPSQPDESPVGGDEAKWRNEANPSSGVESPSHPDELLAGTDGPKWRNEPNPPDWQLESEPDLMTVWGCMDSKLDPGSVT